MYGWWKSEPRTSGADFLLLLGLGNYSAKLHNKVMLFIGGRGERGGK